jgi:hypothetical protein
MKPLRVVIPLIVLAAATPVLAQDFEDAPTLVAFQPTTTHVFAARATTIMEWDARSGTVVRTIAWPGRTIRVRSAARRRVPHDRNGIVPAWEVEGWTFAGVKNTGVYTKSGSGDTPPSSAFR